jgi:hypothetical protein
MVAPVSVFSSFMGSGKETVYGTAVPATVFTPSTSIASEDVKNYVADTAMRGSAVEAYNELPTQGWGTYQYDFPVFMDTVGVPLKGVLGDETATGTAPTVHAISTLNTPPMQPPSYTLVDYNGFEARSFPGCIFSQVAFTLGANGLLTASAQATGLASAPVTKPTQSFSAKTATAGYKGVIMLGGVASTLVESATFTIARTVNPIIAVNGSVSPTAIFAGAVSVSGSMTVIYEDDTFLTPMLNGTSTAVDLSYTNGADILQLHCTNGLFTKAPITRGGNGWMEITVDFTGVANTTDAGASGGFSPIKVTLSNTQTAVY